MTSHPTPSSCKPDVLGEVRNLAAHGYMYLREMEYGFAAQAFQGILDAVDRAASAVSPSQAQSEAPDAWLRKDGMKAMPADEKEAWKEAGQPEIVEDYTVPLYRAAGIQSPPAAPVGGEVDKP